jgi:hypothetical protein
MYAIYASFVSAYADLSYAHTPLDDSQHASPEQDGSRRRPSRGTRRPDSPEGKRRSAARRCQGVEERSQCLAVPVVVRLSDLGEILQQGSMLAVRNERKQGSHQQVKRYAPCQLNTPASSSHLC